MTCVACGYQPTETEQLESPYACPSCEPETWRYSSTQAMKVLIKSLAQAIFGRGIQGAGEASDPKLSITHAVSPGTQPQL